MKNEKGSTATRRRRFILERLEANGIVSTKEIEASFPMTRWQSLKGDADFFVELGMDIRLQQGKFFRGSKDLLWTYELRQEANSAQKDAIGRLGAGLVWGNLEARNRINNQLLDHAGTESIRNVMNYLAQYWMKPHRLAIIDAGTTTAAVARYLKGRNVPDIDAAVAAMRILTNCPPIEEQLAQPHVATEVIGLGGALRKDTFAHTGLLAEQCLTAWNIQADICILGTTSLITRERYKSLSGIMGFACDSEEEARTKSLFLSRSDLRVIVMDSSKFVRRSSSAFCFAPISNKAVDIVITDSVAGQDQEYKEYLAQLMGIGIAVLVAKIGPGAEGKALKTSRDRGEEGKHGLIKPELHRIRESLGSRDHSQG